MKKSQCPTQQKNCILTLLAAPFFHADALALRIQALMNWFVGLWNAGNLNRGFIIFKLSGNVYHPFDFKDDRMKSAGPKMVNPSLMRELW